MFGPTQGGRSAPAHRKECARADAQLVEEARELVLDDVGERADDEQGRSARRAFARQARHERREAGVFALRERRLDAAAGIVEDANLAGMKRSTKPGRGALQIELDDLGRAGADKEQQLDVGPAREQPLTTRSSSSSMSASPARSRSLDDRRGEARLGEDHHARRRLNQMSASAGPDDEKEGVLDFAVKPNDAGQAAKHFTLATLTQNGLAGATSRA